MKPAAIGIRVHSGWAALVAVAGHRRTVDIVERARVALVDPTVPGASQPYHFVEDMELEAARRHLADVTKVSAQRALVACRTIVEDLRRREYDVVGSAILLAAGRPLPSLQGILASHALIHTAEGEFFRDVFRSAWDALAIPVTGFRERDLDDHIDRALGKAASEVRQKVETLGKSLGPPWTKDQKTAALAAAILLPVR